MAVDNIARALAAKAIAGGGGGGTSDYDILSNKPIINQDLSETGFVPSNNTYYRHTGSTGTFTNGIIYRFDGTGYEAVGDCPIKSISAGGVSLAADESGNVNVPVASDKVAGVAKASDNTGGIYVSSNGYLMIRPASDSNISERAGVRAISPTNLDYAVKAAMCDGKGAAWTSEEQKAARARIGEDEYELIEEIDITEDTNTIIRTAEPDGTAYNFKHVLSMYKVPSDVSGKTYFVRCFSNDEIASYCGISLVQRGYESICYVLTQNINGIVWSVYTGNCAVTSSGGASEVFSNIPVIGFKPITKIWFYINDTFKLGEKIYIYGVRA